MFRLRGAILAISFAIMIILLSVLLATHQGDYTNWGPLRLGILISGVLCFASSIWFGMNRAERGKSDKSEA